MENRKKSHKNGLMRCKKKKKNNNEKYKKINNTRGFKQTRITPRKERFLCQINNKKKKKEERIPLCLGLFAREVDDLFTAGTNLNLVGVGILNGSSYCCFALKCVRFFLSWISNGNISELIHQATKTST